MNVHKHVSQSGGGCICVNACSCVQELSWDCHPDGGHFRNDTRSFNFDAKTIYSRVLGTLCRSVDFCFLFVVGDMLESANI